MIPEVGAPEGDFQTAILTPNKRAHAPVAQRHTGMRAKQWKGPGFLEGFWFGEGGI